MKTTNDVVFDIINAMLQASPEASYKRLNPALRSSLSDCISADLPFQPDTFRRVYQQCRGSWWFGDGAGSHVGERYYSHACAVNHDGACQSFEAFTKRPPVLWEEDCKTSSRLHVGARFTWRGRFVTVTSMRSDSLVACTYADTDYSERGFRVGATVGDYNKPFVITAVKRDKKAVTLRCVPAKPQTGMRTVATRVVIPYAEIAEYRRTRNAKAKALIAEILACEPIKDGPAIAKKVAAAHFQHFILEDINAVWARKKKTLDEKDKITCWRDGNLVGWLDVNGIYLRVHRDSIECSNGNSVSIAAARRVLPVLLDRRRSFGTVNMPLDGHTVNSVSADGVKINCTLVPWSEVDYIAAKLAVNQ